MTPIPVDKSQLGPNGLEWVENYMPADPIYNSLESLHEYEAMIGGRVQPIEHMPDHLFPNNMEKLGFKAIYPKTREEAEKLYARPVCKHDTDEELLPCSDCGGHHPMPTKEELDAATKSGIPFVLKPPVKHGHDSDSDDEDEDKSFYQDFPDHDHTAGHCHHPSHNGTHLHPDRDVILEYLRTAPVEVAHALEHTEMSMITAQFEAFGLKKALKAEKEKSKKQQIALEMNQKTIEQLTKALEAQEQKAKDEKKNKKKK